MKTDGQTSSQGIRIRVYILRCCRNSREITEEVIQRDSLLRDLCVIGIYLINTHFVIRSFFGLIIKGPEIPRVLPPFSLWHCGSKPTGSMNYGDLIRLQPTCCPRSYGTGLKPFSINCSKPECIWIWHKSSLRPPKQRYAAKKRACPKKILDHIKHILKNGRISCNFHDFMIQIRNLFIQKWRKSQWSFRSFFVWSLVSFLSAWYQVPTIGHRECWHWWVILGNCLEVESSLAPKFSENFSASAVSLTCG